MNAATGARARHARRSTHIPARWSRTLAFILTGGLILAAVVTPGPQAHAVPDCPEVLPAAEVTPGDTGYGLTVSRGTTPEPFDVEVIGVLENALAPGLPLIVIEATSPEIERVGGIWGGMSGSPVYIDGRLLGAVAYGFSWGPSRLGGVTPAEAMLRITERPTLPPPVMPAEVDLPPELREMAIEDGVARAQAATMQPLEIPVRVSGPSGAKLDRFASSFEERYPGTRVVRGAAGAGWEQDGAGGTTIVPGGNLAVSLAIGDYTAAGTATATYVCGETVLGFGHPLLFDGPTRLGMHGARAIRVVDDAIGGPYKLANPGPLVGTIDHDRRAGVAGRVGTLPVTTAITSEILNLDDAITTTGRTDVIHPSELGWPIVVHGWINYDLLVFDNPYVSGSAEVAWTIEGLRENGSPWRLDRSNRHADRSDLASSSLFEVAMFAELLRANPAEKVRVTSVDYTAQAGTPYEALQILGRQVQVRGPDDELLDARHGIELVPGTTLTLVVPLREFRGEVRTVDVELEIPADAAGFGELVIAGGGRFGDDGFYECFFYDGEECADPDPATFDELLAHLAAQPRNDELIVSLQLYGEDGFIEDEEDMLVGSLLFDEEHRFPTARASVQLDQVVTGSSYIEVFTTFEPGPDEPDPDEPDPGEEVVVSGRRLVGDWNGDGVATPGWFDGGRWHLLLEADTGELLSFSYGRATDTPVVGDWNGDGTQTVGVVRGNRWYLRTTNTGGPATTDFPYGRATDTPVVGDWNGNGTQTVGVVRGNRWYLRTTNTGGPATTDFPYGRATDTPVVGDWNGNGTQTVGVVRGTAWLLRNSNSAGNHDLAYRPGVN